MNAQSQFTCCRHRTRGKAYGALVGALLDGGSACPPAPPASPEELGGLLLPINGWARRAKTALDERFCEMWWLKWLLSAIVAIIL